MTGRIFAFGAAALMLGACSTVQENPNYQFSSKYEEPETGETVQLAQQTPVTPQTEMTVQPVLTPTAPVIVANSGGQAASPTEQAYDADRMQGTPGYEVFLAQQARTQSSPTPSQPVPVQVTPQASAQGAAPTGPKPVAYDYAQNIIVTDESAAQSKGVAVNVPTARSYIVQPGDTVYNISRRLCAPIGDIMTVNAIGSDFGIKIGQTLTLPASRC